MIKGRRSHRASTPNPAKNTRIAEKSPAAITGRRIAAPITLEKRLLARASRYPPILNPPLYDQE